MSKTPIDLTGKRFGRLEVIEKAETRITPKGKNVYMWKCRCDCGNIVEASRQSLKNGNTQSCGCLQKEKAFNYNFIDISGQKFGKLTAIEPKGKGKDNSTLWLCQCDCGNYKIVSISNLRRGHTKSCGCIKPRKGSKKYPSKKYTGITIDNKRLYRIWSGMKSRCYNENVPQYKYYGGRGISVCDEWRNDFRAFYDWAMASGYRDDLTIDRKDNDKDYCPENCKWATMKEQAQNTRQTKTMEYKGCIKTFSEWSEITGIPKEVLKQRFTKGWNAERCIETPLRRKLKSHIENLI